MRLLLDTSYLRKVGFDDPDFRILLEHSKARRVDIVVPHICWEEWRSGMVEKICTKVRELEMKLGELRRPWMGGLLTEDFLLHTVALAKEDEILAQSHAGMKAFAQEHNIEIVPIADDHAARAWKRYFDAGPPFNRDQEREKRRTDIPDSWIFEAALDLHSLDGGLSAICNDGRLSRALVAAGVTVFQETQQVLDVISESIARAAPASAAAADISKVLPERPLIEGSRDNLDQAIASAGSALQELQKKVLGYVCYLRNPSKDQLFSLLSSGGYRLDLARNAAEFLALSGLIEDTGNHYLSKDEVACRLAIPSVESEIIKLLEV